MAMRKDLRIPWAFAIAAFFSWGPIPHPRGGLRPVRAGLESDGHGRSVHGSGRRSLAAVPQRRGAGVRHQPRRLPRGFPGRRYGGTFQGAAPVPGPNARGEQVALTETIYHAYVVGPINPTWKWGVGLYTPFGLETQSQNPLTFPGRFLSTKAAIRAIDVNPSLGWQVTPNFGVGIGAVVRASDVILRRHIRVPLAVQRGRGRRPQV